MKWILSFFFGVIFTFHSSAQEQLILTSDFLNQPDTVWVFTPENHSPESSYPLLYLLHGWKGNYHQWDDMIDCQVYANKYDLIIICPDGLIDSWYIDSPVKGENQYEQYFEKVLIPTISDKYPIQDDPIFITGLSMGGHGALYLSGKNPDYFSGAGSLSGLPDLQGWENKYGISRVLGISDTSASKAILLKKYSVLGNIEQLKKANNPLIVSCGTEDSFYEINVKFRSICITNQIDIRFIEGPGDHNSIYWSSAVDAHFEFFKELSVGE